MALKGVIGAAVAGPQGGGTSLNEEEKKRREAEMASQAGVQGAAPMPMKKGGKVSSASKRADGCCIRGKTKA